MFLDSRLWRLTEGVRGRIAGAVAVGVLASLVGVVRLALLGWLIARVFAGAPLADLAVPIAGVALVMVARGVLEHWRTMIAHETAARVQLALRRRLYDKVVALGPAWLGLERTGDVTLSMIDGVEQLETFFGRYLPQLFVAALAPFAIFAFVAWIDVPVAAAMLGFALFTLIAPAAFHRWDAASSMRRSRAYRAFAAEFLDAIQGLATLKAFGRSAARGRLLAERAHEVFRSTMWVLATNSLTRGITDTGLALGTAAVLALGAWRVGEGAMSLEALLAILMMGIEVYRPQRDLRQLLHDGMLGRAAADGIFGVLAAEPAVRARGDEAPLPADAEPGVAFEDVRFAYPGARRDAHAGLSFSIAPGERVGFVGASGAGKSTIVKLLLRFYDPGAGAVRVAGRDLRDVEPSEIYRRVAVVHQDTYLFHGTVEENLRVGKPDATRDELERAARAANAHEFVARLPHGYATVVGERGIRLSGGQRQRIAIARALLRDAPILVLDEALSAVDAESEAVIQQALDRLMEGRTTLIFAHRLSSVVGADRILALEGGRVVESGTHAELMRRRGVYRRLMAAQAEEGAGAPAAADERIAPVPEGRDATAPERVQDEPTDAILRAREMGWARVVGELMRRAAPWRAKLSAVFVLGVARVVALIGVGVLGALVVAAVKAGEAHGALLTALLVVAPLAGILHWFESWLAHDMAFRMLAEMRVALYDKLERLAPAYLVRRRTGDLVAMATHDVELVEYFFAHTVAPAFVAVLVPAAVLATLVVYGWPMAAVLAPFLVLVAATPFAMRRRIDALGSRAREALADLNAHAVDTLQGLPDIAAFGYAERRAGEFVERIRRHTAMRMPFYRDLSVQTSVVEVATGLGGLAVVSAGAHLVASGRLDAGILPMLTLLAMAAFLPISEIAHIGRQLADTLGATRRLHAVHSEPEAVRDGPGAPRPAAGEPVALALEGVAFSYFGDDRMALRDVSLEVPAGHTVALVGPSGAGKTTIAHLLMRFWDPAGGRVSIDGRDAREHRLDDLRECIALVTQDTYLFNDTLRANIALADPDADEAAIRAAIEQAGLAEFVDALPDGLGTRVGERGVRLSGGQRQRVAIARAFLKDAPVLVLDEATSHLDAVNEQAVRRALESLMSHRTTVIIAHRLSTVRGADRIVVLDDGCTVEQGTHAELLARGGLYRRLVGHQMASAVAAAGR